MSYRILTLNPGSTSTKLALFDGAECLFSANIPHTPEALSACGDISAQLPLREAAIRAALSGAGACLEELSAVVGRGGGLLACEGGTYRVDALLLDHATRGANGVSHPAQLGPQLAHAFAKLYGCPAFVVNPPDTDELLDKARLTGIRGAYRNVHLHALNLKETAIRHARAMGKTYTECNFIVCHLGGGVSVSAHEKGRMIDGNDIVGGEGPMAPTRCGAVPVSEVLRLIERLGADGVRACCHSAGGFLDLLGTADTRKVCAGIASGDWVAGMVWDAMVYQITKQIGAMACALGGRVDGILLGGGMAHQAELVREIEHACGWIAPVTAYPGEFEMEALCAGALRVLRGEEEALTYTGVPVWQDFVERMESWRKERLGNDQADG